MVFSFLSFFFFMKNTISRELSLERKYILIFCRYQSNIVYSLISIILLITKKLKLVDGDRVTNLRLCLPI